VRYRFPVSAVWLLAALTAPCAPSAQPSADPAGAEARVRAAAERFLAERFPETAARLEPRLLRLGAEVDGAATLHLAMPGAGGVPTGTVRAEVYADGARAGWALLYVARYDSVLVARRALQRGDILAADAVETAWMETTRFHGEPALPGMLRRGALPTARRVLDAGEALRATDLAWPVAVDTGDAVRVRYARRGFLMLLDGQAREPGAVGETIRVFCRDTGATYRVRLTAPGEADWLDTL